MRAPSTTRNSIREHRSSILVAALSSAFGVVLLQLTSNIAAGIRADEQLGSLETVAGMLSVLAVVFIVLAVYVGALVTVNTFATIIAGRTRVIALVRLIGASARSQRALVAKEGFVVGLIGSTIGAVVGVLVALLVFRLAQSRDVFASLDYNIFDLVSLVPVGGVVLTTWGASWVGSRRVLSVTPMQALGASIDAPATARRTMTVRLVAATLMAGFGLGTMILGMIVGLADPSGMLISLFGGVLSFSGFVIGAQFVMPRALHGIGVIIGRDAAGQIAAKNSLRYPERSTRTTVGLVIGITLVTTFVVAAESFAAELLRFQNGVEDEATIQLLSAITATFSLLIGFSAIIAGVGLVNNLSLSVIHRTRELGLLRTLGFSAHQLRSMIRVESAQLTIAASSVGLILGILYGWVGAQSLLGSASGVPVFVVPVVPWWILATIAAASAVLALAASAIPARRATAVSPIEALAFE